MPTTFRQLLHEFDSLHRTTTARGRVFERFCANWLRTDPLQRTQYRHIWLWEEWPGRAGAPDTGIDLVAESAVSGGLVAIQCKFYSPTTSLALDKVASFLAGLGRAEFESGILISTTDRISKNTDEAILKHAKDVVRIGIDTFDESPVDWDHFRIGDNRELALRLPKSVRPHQSRAIEDVVDGLDTQDRGQLIMACGTGKTFTSLRLAERVVGAGGTVLFMVPSINLLAQSVRAWANDAELQLRQFAVCSDASAGRKSGQEGGSREYLSFRATTNAEALAGALQQLDLDPDAMTVIFSTYQSIDVVSRCQREGVLPRFDLVIADEAHRTTGATLVDKSESAFVRIHDDEVIDAAKRLYMTATPRLYAEPTKKKAERASATLASMDDTSIFGPELHRLPFGDAVEDGLLTDYKVIVLAVDEGDVSRRFQKELARDDVELSLDDASKFIGCWHALSKRGPEFGTDRIPMQRAVSFTSTIAESKRVAEQLPQIVDRALEDRSERNAIRIEARHVDGTTPVQVRGESIAWLEQHPGDQVCRVLTNAKCLTEGVDVPALDAVLFLKPRKSIVDVVQAVGRVMRLAEGKDFGYVILPVVVPAGVPADQALSSNAAYEVVWEVLRALRSHDERLNAEINKIALNKRSDKIKAARVGLGESGSEDDPAKTHSTEGGTDQMALDLSAEWADAIYAKIVEKVGDRHYWEDWAKDIQKIAESHETRIRGILDREDANDPAIQAFEDFLAALRANLNDGVTRDSAIQMLSQHLITRPVFEAVFGEDRFTRSNTVSVNMQKVVDQLDQRHVDRETETLQEFYRSVKRRAEGLETATGKQQIIAELYEQFFKKAMPKLASSLGIVYTPVEVVDFINRSVDGLLEKHFDASIADVGVHVLDPFAGTGTFLTRLIQSGLIPQAGLARKYASELHANELVLLAYYVAATNIEAVYHDTARAADYQPFDGMVLADTFQMTEPVDLVDASMFPRNRDRAGRQKALDIRVIVGNPPYSMAQASQNDDNSNLAYPSLDASIRDTYAARSSTTLKASLYDSYVRAIRWASNRVRDCADGGVVGFVTNGAWLDSNTGEGLRKTLHAEFHHVYVINLRGNQRSSGEESLREGGKIFGQGSRNTVAISFFVKLAGDVPESGGEIHYHDIGDYLTREDKLARLAEVTVFDIGLTSVVPNEHGDWVGQRSELFSELVPLCGSNDALFLSRSNGLKTNRDAWNYGFSSEQLAKRVKRMISVYNCELDRFHGTWSGSPSAKKSEIAAAARSMVDKDATRYSWDRGDYDRIAARRRYTFDASTVRSSLYRPFLRQNVVFAPELNNCVYRLPALFPEQGSTNRVFSTVTPGSRCPFGALAHTEIADLGLFGRGGQRHHARWRYEAREGDLLDADAELVRVSNINPAAVAVMEAVVGAEVSDDDVFHYAYAVLHSPTYRSMFESDLAKDDPRVPLPTSDEELRRFVDAGKRLFELHAGFDDVRPYPLKEVWTGGEPPADRGKAYRVGSSKMAHPKLADPSGGKPVSDRTRIAFNDYLVLEGIPTEAYEYKVGLRSAVEWMVDRLYVSTHKASGIVNDPNELSVEAGDPRHLVDLFERVIAVSIETVGIVNALPVPAALSSEPAGT